MKKIININLSGRVIPIEDSAYESLQLYIESLRGYFSKEEGRDEIINDIESRIAELMNDKIKKGTTAVTESDITEIINSMGRVEDFEQADSSATASATSASNAGTSKGRANTSFTQENSETINSRSKGRLYRDASDKFLGGVCSGIANYMNIDPAIVRFLFAIITFGGFGFGILIYIILWIVLPLRNLDTYVGKRLFRNPDDRVISGVAGGLAAYMNKPSGLIRLILVAPILLNIIFGIFNGVFPPFHHVIFPNLLFGSFSGTFVLIYIILWIVLPEAKSPFEKMEMRGEKVDVNRIRQNVKDEMENFKTRAQAWGEEIKTTAQQYGNKAKEFASDRGKTFASEVAESTRNRSRGIGHIIGILFKAFFIFIAGCIALSMFAVLMVIIFGGVAWWPINDFLWVNPMQKFLGWSTLLLFFTVPVIGFLIWLIRRIIKVRNRKTYLGWIFGGLWLIGLLCAILFGVSIAKDLRAYDRTTTDLAVPQPSNGRMIVKVNEPEIHFTGSGWINDDNSVGWDVNSDTMRYNNIKLRVRKSDDSLYHVKLYKYSFGESAIDAQKRAERIQFHVNPADSLLNIGSGLSIDRQSKFRGQGVIIQLDVPAGKQVRFDESLRYSFSRNVIRFYNPSRYNRWWGGDRYNYKNEWNDDEYTDWDINVNYIMTSDGKLVKENDAVKSNKGIFQMKNNEDSLRQIIEDRQKQNEEDEKKIHQLEEDKHTQIPQKKHSYDSDLLSQIGSPFIPLSI